MAGRIKGDLAQFREWQHSRNSVPTSTRVTKRILNRGGRRAELFKQPQFSPLKMEEQVVSIYAGVNGYLDKLPLNKVREFEDGLLAYMRGKGAEVFDAIRSSRDLTDATATKLKTAVDAFAASFS